MIDAVMSSSCEIEQLDVENKVGSWRNQPGEALVAVG